MPTVYDLKPAPVTSEIAEGDQIPIFKSGAIYSLDLYARLNSIIGPVLSVGMNNGSSTFTSNYYTVNSGTPDITITYSGGTAGEANKGTITYTCSSVDMTKLDSVRVPTPDEDATDSNLSASIGFVRNHSASLSNISPVVFTASDGQKTFTTNYTVGQIAVYLNGVLLNPNGEYVASDGSTITLSSSITVQSGDTLVIMPMVYSSQVYGVTRNIVALTPVTGQTVYSISGGYIVGQINLFINGILQAPGSYTATDGSTITLSSTVANSLTSSSSVLVERFMVGSEYQMNSTSRVMVTVTATSAGQASYTIPQGYNTDLFSVYLSGLLLDPSCYTATDGETVVLNTSTAATVASGDILTVESFSLLVVSKMGNTRTVYNLTPTAAEQASYTIAGGYTVGQVNVFLSGVLLQDGSDYTATDSSTIVLSSSVAATITTSTVLTVEVFNVDAIDNAVTTTQLQSTTGAGLIGYQLPYTGAVSRTVLDRLNDCVSVKDFGAKGDGTTDDTAAIQNAINYAQSTNSILYFPTGVFNITSTLVVSACCNIIGVFPSANHDNVTPNNTPSMGTWLYFNHPNIGIQIKSSSIGWLGVKITNLGTCRPQNISFGSSWEPSAFDYDFSLEKADDCSLDHIVMLNPTKGIFSSSRCSLSYIYGNPMTQGIYLDNCTDVVRVSQVHFWSYWTTSSVTGSWTVNNLDAITLGRVDNPFLDNIFCYAARALLRCTVTSNGKASKVKLVNADADLTTHLLWIDNSATLGNIGVALTNVSHQGNSTIANGSVCIYIQSSGNQVSATNIRSDYNGAEFTRVESANNIIHISSLDSVKYGVESSAYMFYAVSGSVIDVKGFINYTASTYSSSMFSPTGTFITDTWISYTPTITSATGTPTTVTSVASYTRTAKSITVAGTITVTDIGTAAGTLRVSVPHASVGTAINFVGSARDFTQSTQPLVCYITPSASVLAINGANGTTPWVNGYVIGFTLTYEVP